MHILVTRASNGRRYDVKVQVFHSLTLAVREMYEAHKNKRLVQFCIDHPFDDVLTLTTFDEFAQVFDRESEATDAQE